MPHIHRIFRWHPNPAAAVIVGSLRKESFSLKIAKALTTLAPPSLQLDVITLNGLSFYNQDLEATPPTDWGVFAIASGKLTLSCS